MTNQGNPVASTTTINGELWEVNFRDGEGASGFRFGGQYDTAIPVSGASIVAACRPIYGGSENNWQVVVDVFARYLVLSVNRDDGEVGAWVNNSQKRSGHQIPNGQITILSLVVQPDGSFKIFANGVEILDEPGNGAFTELDPLWQNGSTPSWGSYMNIGRNNGDGWSTFGGNIGDVVVYKGALDTTDREALEASLTTKYGTSTNYTITATAGTGGTLDPVGAVLVPQNSDKTFNITTDYGFVLDDVVVDSVSQGPITSYPFTDVTAAHTIDVTWIAQPTISGTVTDSATTDPIYSATVSLSTNPDGSSPIDTVSGNALGEYVIVAPSDTGTYYLIARKGGHVTSAVKTVVMSGSSVAGEDFVLVKSTGLDPLVDLDASALSNGALTSWANTGSLGGTFDSFDASSTPTVTTVGGKKAVQFVQASGGTGDRETLVGSMLTPDAIAGSSDWTISTVLYRANDQQGGDNTYMCWSGRDINGWPASQYRTADFRYKDNHAAVHWGSDYNFDPVPSADEWHNVTITYDGVTERLYVDGAAVTTRVKTWTLNLKPDTMMLIGGAYWDGNDSVGYANRNEDQHWRYHGSIATLRIYDQALTAAEVLSISSISNPDDTDADGLLDSWELSFPGIVDLTYLNGNADGPGPGIGTGDFDGDGTSDSAEQSLGLIPNDATSTFAATIERDPGTGEVTLTWPSQMGLVFDVLWDDNLSAPLSGWLKLETVTDTDGGPTETYTDTAASPEDIGFYVIQLK